MTQANAGWLVAGASALGAAHQRVGKGNEDAAAWLPREGSARQIVAAVSDGHGAKAHFRSTAGSRIAVDQAVRILAADLQDPDVDDDALAGAVLQAWRTAVLADLSARPYSERDPVTPGSTLGPYGATLLALATDDSALSVLQIGDGDLVLGFPDGRLQRPLRGDDGLIGEETYSLCQDDAETRFRIASLWRDGNSAWPDFALLSTDGVSKSYESDAAFMAAVGQLRDLARSDWAALIADLPRWLSDLSARGSGDDCTLCIALRTND